MSETTEPVAWALVRDGRVVDLDNRNDGTGLRYVALNGDTVRPLVFGDPAVMAVVSEATVEAVAKALRQRDEGTAWDTWDAIKPQTRALYMDEARKILTADREATS